MQTVYHMGMSNYSTYDYKTNGNVVYKCCYHVVWCPKYRRSVLHSGVDERLKQIVHEVCAEFESELVELEVMPDHVHLLVEVDPQFGIHRLIKRIKGVRLGFFETSSLAKKQTPVLVDKFVLRHSDGRCPSCCCQEVH